MILRIIDSKDEKYYCDLTINGKDDFVISYGYQSALEYNVNTGESNFSEEMLNKVRCLCYRDGTEWFPCVKYVTTVPWMGSISFGGANAFVEKVYRHWFLPYDEVDYDDDFFKEVSFNDYDSELEAFFAEHFSDTGFDSWFFTGHLRNTYNFRQLVFVAPQLRSHRYLWSYPFNCNYQGVLSVPNGNPLLGFYNINDNHRYRSVILDYENVPQGRFDVILGCNPSCGFPIDDNRRCGHLRFIDGVAYAVSSDGLDATVITDHFDVFNWYFYKENTGSDINVSALGCNVYFRFDFVDYGDVPMSCNDDCMLALTNKLDDLKTTLISLFGIGGLLDGTKSVKIVNDENLRDNTIYIRNFLDSASHRENFNVDVWNPANNGVNIPFEVESDKILIENTKDSLGDDKTLQVTSGSEEEKSILQQIYQYMFGGGSGKTMAFPIQLVGLDSNGNKTDWANVMTTLLGAIIEGLLSGNSRQSVGDCIMDLKNVLDGLSTIMTQFKNNQHSDLQGLIDTVFVKQLNPTVNVSAPNVTVEPPEVNVEAPVVNVEPSVVECKPVINNEVPVPKVEVAFTPENFVTGDVTLNIDGVEEQLKLVANSMNNHTPVNIINTNDKVFNNNNLELL